MSKLDNYFRTELMPHFTCPGCTHGVALGQIVRAIDSLDLDKDKTVMVCAIGCAGRLPVYLDFPSIRTPHGRALSFATGIKLANPELEVVVFMGDGDSTAIGGNHFIHTARRNIDITAILGVNQIYGMTGGQYAPTTGKGKYASTAPYGMLEPTMNVPELAKGAGATLIGRGDVYHVKELKGLYKEAIEHKGFSVIETFTTCPTHFGRRNDFSTSAKLVESLKDITVTQKQAEKMSEEELESKLIRGILYKEDKPEYIEYYDEVTGFKEEGDM